MPDQPDQASETVLVVDGDVITRTVISDYLRHCGYRVIEANSGEEALQALQHEKFTVEVVLSDVELPGRLSGFDLAKWVRQNKPDIHIVLSSAVERAAEAAGDLCEEGPALAKPYDPKTVIDHIKRLRGTYGMWLLEYSTCAAIHAVANRSACPEIETAIGKRPGGLGGEQCRRAS